jgi:hypothetical protein
MSDETQKRGRKPKTKPYFGEEQEEAVKQFLLTEDINEKNLIYKTFLEKPIKKMADSIIRTYKLYREGFTFEEVRDDAISYLIWKSDNFDPLKGHKAYSYYGTIIRHYVLGLIQKDKKELHKTASFEDYFPSIEERSDLIYYLDDSEYHQEDLIKDVSIKIKEELEAIHPLKRKLTENEIKVGNALIALLDNWEKVFEEMEEIQSGVKYNKNLFLATIRDYTNLNTKDIRISIQRFKSLYFIFKKDKINSGIL